MKEIQELNLPEDIRYSRDHEWVRAAGGEWVVGISDYAQDQLGDVVFVELPAAGAKFAADEVFGTVESVKAVSELLMPVAGTVLAANTALTESPERINTHPYTDAWMLKIQPDNPADVDQLMDRDAYLALLKG